MNLTKINAIRASLGREPILDLHYSLSKIHSRHAVVLRAIADGLSYREAAWRLCLPLGTIKSRANRGSKALIDLRFPNRTPILSLDDLNDLDEEIRRDQEEDKNGDFR